MSQEKHNLYEGMYIISARLSEDARKKAIEKVREGITSHGGTIEKEHEMGRKRLAYEIEGHREGYYFLLYFKAKANVVKELWHEYHLSEDLIRFITLSTDKVKTKLEFKPLVEQK